MLHFLKEKSKREKRRRRSSNSVYNVDKISIVWTQITKTNKTLGQEFGRKWEGRERRRKNKPMRPYYFPRACHKVPTLTFPHAKPSPYPMPALWRGCVVGFSLMAVMETFRSRQHGFRINAMMVGYSMEKRLRSRWRSALESRPGLAPTRSLPVAEAVLRCAWVVLVLMLNVWDVDPLP